MIYDGILYALSAFGGYQSRDNITVYAVFKKAVWWKLTADCHSFDQLLTQYDSRLFSQSIHVDHCLHHGFTYNNRSTLALREGGHAFELPRYEYDLTHQSFIMRALYEFL